MPLGANAVWYMHALCALSATSKMLLRHRYGAHPLHYQSVARDTPAIPRVASAVNTKFNSFGQLAVPITRAAVPPEPSRTFGSSYQCLCAPSGFCACL